MLIGHFGAALALKRADARINLAWLCSAALLIDLLLWLLVLLGVEKVDAPADYGLRHYLNFYFPFSHSLLSLTLWATLAVLVGAGLWRQSDKLRVGVIFAAAVISHWLLDLLVHPQQIPVAWANAPMVGMGLWNHIYIAVGLELLILIVGLCIYYHATIPLRKIGKWGPVVLFGALALITVPGQLFSSEAVEGKTVAASSLILLLVVIALAGWLDQKRSPAPKA